jgi:hypothetical protein
MAFDFDLDLGEILGNVVNAGVGVGAAVLKDKLVPAKPATPGASLGVAPAASAPVTVPAAQTPGQPIQTGGYSWGSILLGVGIVAGGIVAAVLGFKALK